MRSLVTLRRGMAVLLAVLYQAQLAQMKITPPSNSGPSGVISPTVLARKHRRVGYQSA